MLIIMAVGTKVFPIASVRRVILVIAIFVVNRQQVQVGKLEFPGAAGADPAVDFERSFPVIDPLILPGSHLTNEFLNLSRGFCRWTRSFLSEILSHRVSP
jgi:hypothetical protein